MVQSGKSARRKKRKGTVSSPQFDSTCLSIAAVGKENWVKYCMAAAGTHPHHFSAHFPQQVAAS